VLGDLYDQLELAEADLLDKESMIKACEGCTYVAHTASPLSGGDDEDSYVKPAVNGTLFAMEGCKLAGVKRVVVTSSLIAVMAVDPKDRPADLHWDMSIWSNPDRPGGLGPYAKSKTLAERAAWDYVKDLPDGEKFELCTILPTMIAGPSGAMEESGTNKMILNYLMGRKEELSQGGHGIVDVRDCALAQVRAIQRPEAAGHRFAMWARMVPQVEIGKILRDEFGGQGWPIPTKESDKPADQPNTMDIKPVNDILGLQFRDPKETLIDLCNSYISRGVISVPK
jgi:nucleoside-diphosphate-sugar epimerase